MKMIIFRYFFKKYLYTINNFGFGNFSRNSS